MKFLLATSIVLLFSIQSFSKPAAQAKMSKKNNSDETCQLKITEVENLLFADGSVKDIPKFITKNEAAIDFCSSKKGSKVKAFLKSGQTLCKEAYFTKDKFQYGSCVLKVLKIVYNTNPDLRM